MGGRLNVCGVCTRVYNNIAKVVVYCMYVISAVMKAMCSVHVHVYMYVRARMYVCIYCMYVCSVRNVAFCQKYHCDHRGVVNTKHKAGAGPDWSSSVLFFRSGEYLFENKKMRSGGTRHMRFFFVVTSTALSL